MKKNTIYALITIAVIVTFFILGIISLNVSKGTVKRLEEGTFFWYGFQITYSGENYTNQVKSGNELYVVVDEYDPQLQYAKVNVSNTLATGSVRVFILSQLDPPIPSRTLNQSFFNRGNVTGLYGENFGIQGEFFGWIHATISVGEKLGEWTVIAENIQQVGAGTFATYELVQTTYTLTEGIEYITITHLYYEQLTGILVHMEYKNVIRAENNHSIIYYHEVEIMDLYSTSYNFPLLSKVMPLLILMHSVLDMLYTYSLFIAIAILIILTIYFAKKQLHS
ncbi:MAG: hypothetical protein ACTSYB_12045 [Candidatus Helarchaeota archaeon]